MDEIDCKIIVSNSHVFSKQTSQYIVDNIKKMSISEEVQIVNGCQIVTPKYAMFKLK